MLSRMRQRDVEEAGGGDSSMQQSSHEPPPNEQAYPPSNFMCQDKSKSNLVSSEMLGMPISSILSDFGPKEANGATERLEKFHRYRHSDSLSVDGSVVRKQHFRCMRVSLCLVMLVGVTACIIILAVGIMSTRAAQDESFKHVVENLIDNYESIFHDYMMLGLWTHQACLEATESDSPRESFRRFWEYVQEGELETDFLGCAINVTHDEREDYENEIRSFLSQANITVSGVNASSLYFGFKEPKLVNVETQQLYFVPRDEEPFYIPVHIVEPVENPVFFANLDVDIYAHAPIKTDIERAFSTREVRATGRVDRSKRYNLPSDHPNYGVTLAHPGVKREENTPTNLVAIFPVSCNYILQKATENFHLADQPVDVMVYDSTPNSTDIAGTPGPFFLCGGRLHHSGSVFEFFDEVSMEVSLQSPKDKCKSVESLQFASREWTLVISAVDDSAPNSQLVFIVLGGVLILVSSICLSCLIYINAKNNNIKASMVAEKAKMRLESARRAAQQERDLNDFIAHEVRNPLNAALAANTFVSASVNEAQPLITEAARTSVREDVKIIDNSLHFINDLLRNMLDMQRAASHQLKIDHALVDLKKDVLEPAGSMLYRRGAAFEVIVDCPFERLVIESDKLRLTQILLNLGRNSAKFVEKGFVRFRTAIVDGGIQIYVEDSGPGVPLSKQDNLFGRFQESLDSLNQGTGIGLALCKDLTELLGGRIWLDRDYDSGIEGCLGARFVVDLRVPPIDDDEKNDDALPEVAISIINRVPTAIPEQNNDVTEGTESSRGTEISSGTEVQTLPPGLSVLFVDDDFTLRKLFVRSVARVTTDWNIDQASNGETALVKIDEGKTYDIIFMDMYMASTTKQLLGTEATRELRSKGCQSIIYGLSANDLETQFLEAGGNGFIMKPFPCKPDLLKEELLRVVRSGNDKL